VPQGLATRQFNPVVPESDPEVVFSEAISEAAAAFGRGPKCGSDRYTQRPSPLLNQISVNRSLAMFCSRQSINTAARYSNACGLQLSWAGVRTLAGLRRLTASRDAPGEVAGVGKTGMPPACGAITVASMDVTFTKVAGRRYLMTVVRERGPQLAPTTTVAQRS
jgi:hypothetical protein